MTIYSVILFIHVVSAIGLFVALAAEGMILFHIRASQNSDEARFFTRAFQRLRVIAIPAFLGILLGGLYLASKYGGGTFWIPLGLISTILIMLVGGIVTGRKMSRLKWVLSKTEDVTSFDPIRTGTKDNALIVSYGLRSGLAVGIVFLMTAKPLFSIALTALAVASIAGVLATRGAYQSSSRDGMDCGAGNHFRNSKVARPD